MSIWVISSSGSDLWNPAQRKGRLFLANVRALEEFIGLPSGVSDVYSDEIEVDTIALEAFIRQAIDHFDDPIVLSQAQGVLAASLVLVRRDRLSVARTGDLAPLWKVSEELEIGMSF